MNFFNVFFMDKSKKSVNSHRTINDCFCKHDILLPENLGISLTMMVENNIWVTNNDETIENKYRRYIRLHWLIEFNLFLRYPSNQQDIFIR